MTVFGSRQLNDFNLDLRDTLLVAEIKQTWVFYELAPFDCCDPPLIQFGLGAFQNLPVMNISIGDAVINRNDMLASKRRIRLDAPSVITAGADLLLAFERNPIADFSFARFHVECVVINLHHAQML
jgi:hypothetical protein